jgi:hypothetical protein
MHWLAIWLASESMVVFDEALVASCTRAVSRAAVPLPVPTPAEYHAQ